MYERILAAIARHVGSWLVAERIMFWGAVGLLALVIVIVLVIW